MGHAVQSLVPHSYSGTPRRSIAGESFCICAAFSSSVIRDTRRRRVPRKPSGRRAGAVAVVGLERNDRDRGEGVAAHARQPAQGRSGAADACGGCTCMSVSLNGSCHCAARSCARRAERGADEAAGHVGAQDRAVGVAQPARPRRRRSRSRSGLRRPRCAGQAGRGLRSTAWPPPPDRPRRLLLEHLEPVAVAARAGSTSGRRPGTRPGRRPRPAPAASAVGPRTGGAAGGGREGHVDLASGARAAMDGQPARARAAVVPLGPAPAASSSPCRARPSNSSRR